MRKVLSVLGLTAAYFLTTNANATNIFEKYDGVKLSGVLKLDQRFFKGDKDGDYHSGAHVRDLGLNIDGDISKDLSYSVGLSFNGATSTVGVEDAFVTYKGLGENFNISVGQINPGFCLENTSSSKWIPFMERSIASSAFGPCPGLGASLNKWDDKYSLNWAISQPKSNSIVENAAGQKISDRWQTSARFTFAPYKADAKLFQIGLSGHVQDDSRMNVRFDTAPEARARNLTKFLDTGNMEANSHSTFDVELLAQYNSWIFETEYQRARVHRVYMSGTNEAFDHVNFNGYHAHIAYVLTGETRPHKPNSGTFGQIKPNSASGAWEVGLRHSYVNLNAFNINGGSAHNTTIALSWYANNNVRVTGEYLHMNEHKNGTYRHVNSVGTRLQVIF